MKNVACFDIGGTFIKYGIVSENGIIIYKNKFSTPKPNCRNVIPAMICEKVNELKSISDFDCIGISSAGQVDSKNGNIIFASDNLPDYTGTKLAQEITKLTRLKCSVDNDVNCAALGELWKGAIGNHDSFFFLALGTGIGGAIIINGRLHKGYGGSAGEIGHIIINENGIACTCGGSGCYERYASASSLVRHYCEASNSDPKVTDGEKIMELVHSGDKLATKIYSDFVDHIVTGIVSVTYLLDPGLIVIGGGISEQEDLITDINNRFKKRLMPSYSSYTNVISSSLKNDAGLLGACYVGLNY